MSTGVQAAAARESSSEELVERARAAATTLAENAEQTEKDLRPSQKSVAAVREAGLFALTVSRRYGGFDANARTVLRVITELGRGCPSTAWVTGLSTGQKSLIPPLLSEQARADFLADPDAIVCSSGVGTPDNTAEEVPDGLRISGRWRTASGCEDSVWSSLILPVRRGDSVTVYGLLVPTAQLTIERTWQVAGMAGTGSHTLVADDVLVPATHATSMMSAEGTLRFGPVTMLGALTASLGPSLGAALSARDLVQALLSNKAPYGTSYQRAVDSPMARYWFTDASQLIDTAMRRCLTIADTLDATDPEAGLPVQERSRLRMEMVTAAQECRQGMEKLLDLHGASGFTLDNPVQRLWRDVAVGSRHPQFSPYITAEDYGRLLLGVETPVMMTL